MDRFLAVVLLGGMAIASMSVAEAKSGQSAGSQPALTSESSSGDLPALPPAPRGKSTILGGVIGSVDPVRDELALKVFGQRPVKILFDERTEVYRDGKKTSLRDVHSADYASVQTVLDGTGVFALSIHILSRSPEGEYQGRVLNYNPDTRELTVSAVLSREPIKLLVPMNTPVVREGQAELSLPQSGSSDLGKGALISVKFESDGKGRGVASQIAILATPGSVFVFTGDLSELDVHSGILALVDPRDEKSYQITFDSARLPTSRNLHVGDHVMVTASFDGIRYVASAIKVD